MAGLPRLTARGWTLAGIAFGLYFFANQTQVGWLYVLSALAAGLLLVCAWLPGAMLRGLALARRVGGASTGDEVALHAGSPALLALDLSQRGRVPALHVLGVETCGFAPRAERAQTFFVPVAPARGSTTLAYTVLAARRGWFPFAAVPLTTRAPFGLFTVRRVLAATGPAGVLVFPECVPLKRLALLDRQPAVEHSQSKAGAGGEFVGVREHQPGDPRRHIHWRSTARAGRLIVKEFAEERQPGLTLALDLRAASVLGGDEDNTLELAIKVAASLAHYAHQRHLPVGLVVNSRQWPAPPGELSWWALMSYLARAQAEGSDSLAGAVLSAPLTNALAVVLPAPDAEMTATLIGLRQAGQGVLAAVVDPSAFAGAAPEAARHARDMVAGLQAAGVGAVLVGAGWEEKLGEA